MSSDYFPWQDIYEGNVFPAGIFMFEIEEINVTNMSKGGDSGIPKLMPKSRFRCVEPDAVKGGTHFDQYVVGTDENPEEVNNGTFGAKALKAIFVASQTPKGTSLAELAMNAVGNRVLIQFGEPTEDDWGLKSKVITYHKVGDREVGMNKRGGPVGGGAAKAKSSGKEPMLPCPHCGNLFPKSKYNEHVNECDG